MLEEGALAILALGTLGTASTTAELPARLNGLEPRRPLLPGFVRPRVTKLRFWRQVETQKTGSGAERRRESSLMHGAAFEGKEGAVVLVILVLLRQLFKPSPLAAVEPWWWGRAVMVSDPRVIGSECVPSGKWCLSGVHTLAHWHKHTHSGTHWVQGHQ